MIEVRTLGALSLRTSDGRELRGLLARPKRFAFLAYLSAATARLHSRDTLLALFWPECDECHARIALRQTLHVLRRELGSGVVVSRGALIGLAEDRLWCDAAAFECACERGAFAEALELYRGEFLPGIYVPGAPAFERWLEDARASLRDRAALVAWKAAEECERAGSFAQAGFWARRAVALRPEDEVAVRALMVLLDRAGDRVGAVRVYEAFARRLAAEFELTPSPETRRLASAIRREVCPAALARELPGVNGLPI